MYTYIFSCIAAHALRRARYIHTCIYTRARYTYMHTYVYFHVYVHVYIHIHIYSCIALGAQQRVRYICMYVYMYVYVYAHTYTHTCIHVHSIYSGAHTTQRRVYVCVCMFVCVCMCACVCWCVYVCMSVYAYACMRKCMWQCARYEEAGLCVCVCVCVGGWVCVCVCVCGFFLVQAVASQLAVVGPLPPPR